METFIYRAKSGPDKIIEGKMIANSVQEVVDRLNQEGYIATYVKEEKKEAATSLFRFLPWLRGRIPFKELVAFSQQLSLLLKGKIPILKALRTLSDQTSNLYFKQIIEQIMERVKNGETLSASLEKHPKIFSFFYVTMVKVGEESGALDRALARLTEYYVSQFKFISKIRSALVYPLLILLMGFFTLIFVFTEVIPRIIPLVKSLNVPLPLPTKILIFLSSFLVDSWPFIVLAGLLFILIGWRAVNNKTFRQYLSMVKLNLPLLGGIIFKAEFAKFARTLEILLQSGVSIVKGWEVSLPIVKESVLRVRLEESLRVLKSGGRVCDTLKSHPFPPLVYNLIETAEAAGMLTEAFSLIAESFELDCQEFIKISTTLLEPIMVLVIGLVIGFIVAAVLLPIFQLNFMHI